MGPGVGPGQEAHALPEHPHVCQPGRSRALRFGGFMGASSHRQGCFRCCPGEELSPQPLCTPWRSGVGPKFQPSKCVVCFPGNRPPS